MLEEDATAIAGLLLGLNVIDCTFSMKDCNLDEPVKSNKIIINIFSS